MTTKWLIEKKRDGGELTADEIRALVRGYAGDAVPDSQMAAFAMAVYFRGMTPAETAVLTDAMMNSGEVLDLSGLSRPTADKHSTGGIGDNVSLILAPLAAAAGMAVPMISGRGLGITGGTLDKLESIRGFRVNLPVDKFKRIVGEIGCCMIGQTDSLAPADRKLYALRDVTGTIPSIPLITSSIMSKKLAEGAQTLVLDVKCGRGAFMRNISDARALAESLLRTGTALDRRMAALITDMERPLGTAIGNAVEVAEALEVLKGGGPLDLRLLTIELTAHMAVLAGIQPTLTTARAALGRLLDDGSALEIFGKMITAQGGDAAIIDDAARLPEAPVIRDVPAPRDGFVADIDAEELGRAVLTLGGGRKLASDAIDHAVGLSRLCPVGARVERGENLVRIHARTDDSCHAVMGQVAAAVTLAESAPQLRPLILETLSEARP